MYKYITEGRSILLHIHVRYLEWRSSSLEWGPKEEWQIQPSKILWASILYLPSNFYECVCIAPSRDLGGLSTRTYLFFFYEGVWSKRDPTYPWGKFPFGTHNPRSCERCSHEMFMWRRTSKGIPQGELRMDILPTFHRIDKVGPKEEAWFMEMDMY